MKEVRVCEAMKSPVGTLSEGTVLHQQDGGTKSRQVRVCTAKRSNESPGGDFKRRNGLASARWRDQVPTSSDLGKEQSDAGRSCGLLWHWHQQAAFIIG